MTPPSCALSSLPQLSLSEEQNDVTKNGCDSKELVYLVHIACQVSLRIRFPFHIKCNMIYFEGLFLSVTSFSHCLTESTEKYLYTIERKLNYE